MFGFEKGDKVREKGRTRIYTVTGFGKYTDAWTGRDDWCADCMDSDGKSYPIDVDDIEKV